MMLKIMIVEDDLDLLHGLRFLLQGYNCKVCTLSDGGEIVRTADLLQPDLILLDIQLKHTNGLEICRAFKKSKLKHIPVYIISGLPDAEKNAYQAGADLFIAKPFDSEYLLSKIESLAASAAE